MSVLVLHPIDWIHRLAPVEPGWPDLTSCDLCSGTASDDFMAGLREPRSFHRQFGGVDDGLVVCERCMEQYLAEKPA